MRRLISSAFLYFSFLFLATSCSSNRKIIEYFKIQHEENYQRCMRGEYSIDFKTKRELCLQINEDLLDFSTYAVKSSDSLKKLHVEEYLIFYSVSNINNKTCSFVYVPNKNGALGTANSVRCKKFSKAYLSEVIDDWNDWRSKKENGRFSLEYKCCGNKVHYIISKKNGETLIYKLYG